MASSSLALSHPNLSNNALINSVFSSCFSNFRLPPALWFLVSMSPTKLFNGFVP